MRHRKSFNHLGRQSGHRKAMLANMATSLIIHKRIRTTTAKARALRMYVEPLLTKSKEDSTHSRRVVYSYLQSKEAVTELFRDISPKIAERPGGYTRILKTGTRLGDNADMCIIELVDYNENLLTAKEDGAKSGRKRRRGSKKKTEGEAVRPVAATGAATVESTAVEATEVVEEVVEPTAEAEVAEELVEEVKVVEEAETPVAETSETASDETSESEKKEDDKKEE